MRDRASRPWLRAASWLALGLVLVAATPAHADALDDARAKRRQGIGLGIAGLSFAAAGAGMLAAMSSTPSCDAGGPRDHLTCDGGGWFAPPSPLLYVGVGVGLIGVVITTIGAVQWGIGAHRIAKLQRATAAR